MTFLCKKGFADDLSIPARETLQAVANSVITHGEKDTIHPYLVWTSWQDQKYISS